MTFQKSYNFSKIGEAEGRYNKVEIDKTESVGRFNISLQLISDLTSKYGDILLSQMDNKKPILSTSSIQHMPIENPNFEWRVRVDIRAGIDMPLNSVTPHKMPSIFAEVAWSESLYYQSVDPYTKQYTIIYKESRHPHWN